MDFLEKNLEDIIFETENKLLRERGLFISGKKLRQITIGNYGRSDIITVSRYYGELEITIFELKSKELTWAAYHQAIRYAKGVERYLLKRNFPNFTMNIVLIGSSIEKNSDFVYITDLNPRVNIVTYKYGFDGIQFDYHRDYKLTNEGF